MPLFFILLALCALTVVLYYFIFVMPERRQQNRTIAHNDYLRRREYLIHEKHTFDMAYVTAVLKGGDKIVF